MKNNRGNHFMNDAFNRTNILKLNDFLVENDCSRISLTPITISIDEIHEGEDLEGKDLDCIDSMVAILLAGGSLPPICVEDPDYKDKNYMLIDGHHRWLAFKKAGRKTIEAYYIPSSTLGVCQDFGLDSLEVASLLVQ